MAQSSSTASVALAPPLDGTALFAEARTETLRMADINQFFICKLCKGYLRDPYTVKECLHTFVLVPNVQSMKELAEKLLPNYSAKEEAEGAAFAATDVPLFLTLGKLKAPCMNTQAHLKIMHLRKYLAKKLKVKKPEEIEILCKGTAVGPEYSLEFIRRTRWNDKSKMVLEYRRQLVAL
uniref:RAWUL domain-containing protein n=1 Tax=Phytophthora ramorum TaxID=164328 RepID=H3GQ37_PHYRM